MGVSERRKTSERDKQTAEETEVRDRQTDIGRVLSTREGERQAERQEEKQ